MSMPHIVNNADERSNMGFPMIPFAVFWPVIQLVAVPLIKAVLPWILERIADSIRSGQPVTFTDDELRMAVANQETSMRTVYRGN